jgi:tryptophan synthase alpha chain
MEAAKAFSQNPSTDTTASRISRCFSSLNQQDRKALIPFITAGDPDVDTTLAMIAGLEEAGADIIELGMPYSDPLADGPVLQRAAQRALKAGMNPTAYFDVIRRAREHTQLPLVGLVYVNTLLQYGWEAFGREASQAGLDGIVIPDLPLEARFYAGNPLAPLPLTEIRLVAPTSHQRIRHIARDAEGFLYCIAALGVTGVRKHLSDLATDLEPFMDTVKQHATCPTALGFGISSPEMVRDIRHLADGFIVGSALVEKLENGMASGKNTAPALAFIRSLREVLDE